MNKQCILGKGFKKERKKQYGVWCPKSDFRSHTSQLCNLGLHTYSSLWFTFVPFLFFFWNFLLLFSYSCPAYFPLLSSALSHSHTQSQSPPLPLPMSPVFMFFGLPRPFFSPISPFSPILWSLSICFIFPSLCYYFAHWFVLLIRFHLLVRSYGIFLSPPGLFHLE